MMARSETSKEQTPDSLIHLADELESYAAQLRAAAARLKIPPEIASVEVKYESSRGTGFEYIRTWANAAHQAAFEARLAVTQKTSGKNGVRKTVPVSDPGPKPQKP
jgi:hypothetical protein